MATASTSSQAQILESHLSVTSFVNILRVLTFQNLGQHRLALRCKKQRVTMQSRGKDEDGTNGMREQLGARVARYRQTRALLQWAKRGGAWISDKIELRDSIDAGRGFFALSRIAGGEDLCRLPVSPDFMLTQASARADARVGGTNSQNVLYTYRDVYTVHVLGH